MVYVNKKNKVRLPCFGACKGDWYTICFSVFGGISVLKPLIIGLLVALRLSLIIVAATIGLEFGFITEVFKT
ncbi:hypothetical protein DSCO28_37240 [Desulfosarcina ovata subsp. sediminis]|uniref:Uncharacterized protein n=1 Tax=Desulfosarcina ovata subsp. sediminis TaxID=885957 RepID=A0A5K7ZSH8_9BACT|nr:hypothetical protein DSCO28_37240 [Desulfosarcina ovata subsp. sediminis]